MRQLKLNMIYFLTLLFVYSCSVKHNRLTHSDNETLENENYNQPIDTIAFLLFSIQKSKLDTKIILKSISKSEGIIKDKNIYSNFIGDKLSFYFYNQNIAVDSFFLEHPLFKKVEYTDDENKFVSKQLDLDSTDFFIRIQLKNNYQTLKVTEQYHNKLKEILTVQLK